MSSSDALGVGDLVRVSGHTIEGRVSEVGKLGARIEWKYGPPAVEWWAFEKLEKGTISWAPVLRVGTDK